MTITVNIMSYNHIIFFHCFANEHLMYLMSIFSRVMELAFLDFQVVWWCGGYWREIWNSDQSGFT